MYPLTFDVDYLGTIALVLTVLAWVIILITGSYPARLFNFVVGVMRWNLRVDAYMLILATDEYPPFSLS